jgi:predicted DNA-binding transcriptional regulator AlpA
MATQPTDYTLILLTPVEAARRLSVSLAVLERHATNGTLPPPRRLGRTLRFVAAELIVRADALPVGEIPWHGLRRYSGEKFVWPKPPPPLPDPARDVRLAAECETRNSAWAEQLAEQADPPLLLTLDQVARQLAVSKRWVQRHAGRAGFPPLLHLGGRTVRIATAALVEYVHRLPVAKDLAENEAVGG